jgi:hypothetical protein
MKAGGLHGQRGHQSHTAYIAHHSEPPDCLSGSCESSGQRVASTGHTSDCDERHRRVMITMRGHSGVEARMIGYMLRGLM